MRRLIATVPDWRSVAPWDQARYIVPGVFGGNRVEPMLADLGRLIPAWRPDLLIHDSAEMAGPIAAERAGIPSVEHSFGIIRRRDLIDAAMASLDSICARLGLRHRGLGAAGFEPYLDVCPPGIQLPDVAGMTNVLPLRPVGFDEAPDAIVPPWIEATTGRPLVYVTMGTMFNDRPGVFQAVIGGLTGRGFDVVVTVGRDVDPAVLGSPPADVRVERFIPQSAVLARSRVFVSHGGSGALLGAVRAGVPMLVIPQGADQFMNAERVVATGIGRRLMPDEFDARAVRDAIEALIEDERYLRAVRSHRASIEQMPLPEAVVPVLVAPGNGEAPPSPAGPRIEPGDRGSSAMS